MRALFSVAPGVIWTAIIVFLMLLADWLQAYFGGVVWVAPLAGFLAAVLVPVLKLLAQGNDPSTNTALLRHTSSTARPSKLKRWLL